MDRSPATSFATVQNPLVAGHHAAGRLIAGFGGLALDRRDFLKRCGLTGLVMWGVTLAGCESSRGIAEPEARLSSFFADGTDFAD